MLLPNFISLVAWLGIAATITGRAHGCQPGSICTDATIRNSVNSYTAGNPNNLPPIGDYNRTGT